MALVCLLFLLFFFRDLVSFRSSIASKKQQKILLRVLISSIPLLFVGLFLKSLVSWSFKEPVVASGFFITGTLLLSLRFNKNTQTVDIENLSLAKAFIIGVFQSLAVLPGFSRSGWTISSCLFLGLGKKDSVYYSFLIAIPAIGGSLLIELVQNFANIEFSYYLLVAFLVSYLSGTLALFLILKLVQKQRFSIFAFYLIPLGFYLLLF